MLRYQVLLVSLLVVIALELALIASRLPLATVRAQASAPVPVVIVDPNLFGGECPGILRNCAKVEQGGALRVTISR
jgi:hypothetical protein